MENTPNTPQNSNSEQQDGAYQQKQLRIIQFLLIGAAVLCPISLILGLVPSLAATVCAVIALVKISKLSKQGNSLEIATQRLQTISIVAVCICGVVLVLQIFILVIMYPMFSEVLESGDLSALDLNGTLSDGLATDNNGSKTWG